MMDNLCMELVQYGTPPPGSGFVDLAYAILQIDWHFTRLQKMPNPLWNKAIRILWNAGAMQRGGDFAINVGQMMRRLKGNTYPGGKR